MLSFSGRDGDCRYRSSTRRRSYAWDFGDGANTLTTTSKARQIIMRVLVMAKHLRRLHTKQAWLWASAWIDVRRGVDPTALRQEDRRLAET